MERTFRDGRLERAAKFKAENVEIKQKMTQLIMNMYNKHEIGHVITQKELMAEIGTSSLGKMQNLIQRAFGSSNLGEVLRHLGLPSKQSKPKHND